MGFRYRTLALVGPWRDSLEEALDDAVAAGQAFRDENCPSRVVWRVDAELEKKGLEPSEST